LDASFDLLNHLQAAIGLLIAGRVRGFTCVLAEVRRDWSLLRLPGAQLRLSDVPPEAVALAAVLHRAGRTGRSAVESAKSVRGFAEEARKGARSPFGVLASLAAPIALPAPPPPVRRPPNWTSLPEIVPPMRPKSTGEQGTKRVKAALSDKQKRLFEHQALRAGLRLGEAALAAVEDWTNDVLGGVERRMPAADIGRAEVRRFPKQVTIRLPLASYRRFHLAVAVAQSSATHCARCALLRWTPRAL